MGDVIARLDLICVRPLGERIPVAIEIGRPYEIRDGEGADCAACPTAMRGLYDRLPDIHGENTFQALLLAIRFVRRLLNDFVENGGQIFLDDHSAAIDVESLFGELRTS